MNLSEIFNNNAGGDGGLDRYDATEAAPDFAPLPPGVYVARVLKGEYTTTRAGADAYRLRFVVIEGEHVGKTLIRTWTFSERALPYVKRDLTPFGLTSSAKLLGAFPEPGREYRVKLWVAVQCSDDGRTFNDVKKVQLITAGPPTDPPAPTTAGLPPELARFALGKGKGAADDR